MLARSLSLGTGSGRTSSIFLAVLCPVGLRKNPKEVQDSSTSRKCLPTVDVSLFFSQRNSTNPGSEFAKTRVWRKRFSDACEELLPALHGHPRVIELDPFLPPSSVGWEDFALFPILSPRFVGSCFSDGRFKFFRLVCRFTNRAHLIFVRILPKGPHLATVRSKDHKELPLALGDKTDFVIELEQLASVLPVRLQRSLVLWQKHITQENTSRVSQEDDRSVHEAPDALCRRLFQQQSLAPVQSSYNQQALRSWWTAFLTPAEPTCQFRPYTEAPVFSMWQRD